MGNPVDYVRQAASEGCSGLGISDHCPYPDDGVWSGSRMSVAGIPRYLEMVRSGRAEATFPFFWGFECEWYPAYEHWYRDYLRAELGAEYLVYGAHWVNDNGEFWYIPDVHDKPLLRRYTDLTIQGLDSGLYDLFAHPDLFLAGFPKMDEDVRSVCAEIIDAAVANGIPMEINGLGLRKSMVRGDQGMRPPYPVREFWEMAAERGACIVCCSDAHRIEDVLDGTRESLAFAESIGVQTIDAVTALALVPKAVQL